MRDKLWAMMAQRGEQNRPNSGSLVIEELVGFEEQLIDDFILETQEIEEAKNKEHK